MTNNVSASTRAQNSPNYLGVLHLLGNNQTPFMSRAMANGVRIVGAHTFPLNTNYELEAAAQRTYSEETLSTAGTPITYVNSQDTQVVQLMRYPVQVTYKRLSEQAKYSGLNIQDGRDKDRLVEDIMAFAIEGQLKQLKVDMEYSAIQGSYVAENAYGTNQKARGLIEACTSNTVDASSTALSETHINNLLDEMAASGAIFEDAWVFANSFQLRKIQSIYGNDPESRTEGGRNIRRIMTPYGILTVAYAPKMPTDKLLIAEMSVVKPVFSVVPGEPEIWFEEKSFDGCIKGGHIYTQWSLDYRVEKLHGTITALTTA